MLVQKDKRKECQPATDCCGEEKGNWTARRRQGVIPVPDTEDDD